MKGHENWFVITRVRTEKIYKKFVRQNPRHRTVGTLNWKARYIRGSLSGFHCMSKPKDEVFNFYCS